MNKHYPIRLTVEERGEIECVLDSGRKTGRKVTRARILLLADNGKKDREIAKALQICPATVHNVRKRFFNLRSISSLEEKPRSGRPPRLTDITAAHVRDLVCSEPPGGRKRWTFRLLADRAMELDLVDTISHEGVRKILKAVPS
jgi:transposase